MDSLPWYSWFRMPLFSCQWFLLPCLAQTWRTKHARQRSVRILLPCLLGTVTIVPLDTYVGRWATNYGKKIAEKKQSAESKEKPDASTTPFAAVTFTVKSFLDKKKKKVDINP